MSSSSWSVMSSGVMLVVVMSLELSSISSIDTASASFAFTVSEVSLMTVGIVAKMENEE